MKYEEAKLEIIYLETQNVITTSQFTIEEEGDNTIIQDGSWL